MDGMIRQLGCTILLVLGLAGCAASGPQSCKPHLLADLPLIGGTRTPAVVATLNGHKVALLIDTGASTSIVSPHAADLFHLYPDMNGRTVMIGGIGGEAIVPVTTIRALQLGNGIARDIELPIATNLSGSIDNIPILGLFGADFLSNYDVDLDVPGRHFAMYRLQDCENNPPFDPPYFQVPFHNEQTKIELTIKLNDVPIDVQLDSGASHTTITRDDARHVGLSAELMAHDRTANLMGVDVNKVEARVHRFGSLEIGDEKLRNFRFAVADIENGQTLLGDDFLHFNRVWISYPQQMLTIQPAFGNKLVHQMNEPTTVATPTMPK